VQKPLPASIQGMRGFGLLLEKVELGLATNIKGYATVTVADPLRLIDMVKHLIPGFDALNVPADGKPVALPKSVMSSMLPAAYVAMSGSTVGLSMGNGSEIDLARVIAATPQKPSPLFYFAFDHERLMTLLHTVNGMFGGSGGDDAFPLEGRFEMSVGADERGLEMTFVHETK
jgi:hypothetical protein